jgi:hypothetical protein
MKENSIFEYFILTPEGVVLSGGLLLFASVTNFVHDQCPFTLYEFYHSDLDDFVIVLGVVFEEMTI